MQLLNKHPHSNQPKTENYNNSNSIDRKPLHVQEFLNALLDIDLWGIIFIKLDVKSISLIQNVFSN